MSSPRPPAGRKPDSAGAARQAVVVSVLEPVVAAGGLDLEDVELRTVGRRLVVRVLVDSDSGATLDEIAAASQAVSDALDSSDVLGDEPYTLEVSSPGVDRPLTEPRHWRRNVGRLVAVTRHHGAPVTARIVEVTDTEAVLETDDKGRKTRTTIAFADVLKAVVQVEFSRKDAALLDAAADADDGDDADDTDHTDDRDDSDADGDELDDDGTDEDEEV